MKLGKLFAVGAVMLCLTTAKGGNEANAENGLSHLMARQGNANADSGAIYQDWTDTERNRTIPVKIYMPTTGSAPYPIVIFSHGLGGTRDAAPYLGEYWSHHGYLGIFIQHPGSDASVWQASGAHDRAGLMAAMKPAANGRNSIDRVQDVKFTIDQLEKRNQSDPLLQGKLDLTRIAMSGHSFGAGTTLYIAGQTAAIKTITPRDPRVKAAIYLCAPVARGRMSPEESYGALQVPGLFLTGTKDDSPINDTKAADRRIPFDATKAKHQYLVTFDGANHGMFGGGKRQGYLPENALFYEQVEKLTVEFLDASLKNDANAWHWMDSEAATYLGKSAVFEKK